MNSNNPYVYCYRNNLLFRTTKEGLDLGLCGYGYRVGFGWITESKNLCDLYNYWIDGELSEEEAKQFIRDNYHEEPVNFYGAPRSYKEEANKHKQLEDIKQRLGY